MSTPRSKSIMKILQAYFMLSVCEYTQLIATAHSKIQFIYFKMYVFMCENF